MILSTPNLCPFSDLIGVYEIAFFIKMVSIPVCDSVSMALDVVRVEWVDIMVLRTWTSFSS